jgi:hypothetical protein
MQLVETSKHKAVGHTGGFSFSVAAVDAGSRFDDVINAAETILNSRTMMIFDLIDPTYWADQMFLQQNGYSIWDTEEELWDRCYNAEKCI